MADEPVGDPLKLDKYAKVGYTKLKTFILDQELFDQPFDMVKFFQYVKFQIIKTNMYADLDKLSDKINTDHIIVKMMMKNIIKILDFFKVFESDGLQFVLKKQYKESKSNYYFANVKLVLFFDEETLDIAKQIKGYYEFQVDMKIKQNNEKYITKELIFTPMLWIVDDENLVDGLLKYIYRDGALMPTVDLEIEIPKKELGPAVFMKEMTQCLFYAMSYNGFDLENSDKVTDLKTTIKEAITTARDAGPNTSPTP